MSDLCSTNQYEEETMRFLRAALIMIMSLLMLNGLYAQGPLEVVNSGFDTGDLSGWSIWPTSGTHQEASEFAAMNGGTGLKMVGASAAVYQTLAPPKPGDVYYARGYTMNPSENPMADGQEIRIEITFFDDSWGQTGQLFSTSMKSDATKDEWVALSIAGQCPEGTVNMNVGFNWIGTGDAATAGAAYCDDLRAHHLVTPPGNTNLSFEEYASDLVYDANGEDWDPWWVWGYEPNDFPSEISSLAAHTGDNSVLLRPMEWYDWGDPWAWGGYWNATGQDADVPQPAVEGDPFYIGAWLMTPGDDPLFGSVSGYVKIDFKDPGGNNIDGHRPESVGKVDEISTPDEWIWVEVWGEAPANCGWAACYIGLAQYGDAYGVVLADDVIIASGAIPATGVAGQQAQPAEFGLAQNYPNPFNPVTNISYSIGRNQHVNLTVYDILGKEIAVLQDGVQNTGEHHVRFDASELSSGIYIYRLETENQTMTKRMILMQ